MIRVADLFCGAGGETTGIMQALGEIGGRSDVAAVNHWSVAIETHKRNHPEALSA
jgi:DNA (cytosine-5)-methyltransferase 1